MIRALLLAAFLTGCATQPGEHVVTGGEVQAPGGYTLLCNGPDAGPECGR